ncbi:hypothetical protein HPP92_028717 [Vanilla planifolia]|uniref:Uncharacterized protein n=1 Tax=Vanilla planifolia TaxID=51239 RepID=A0A835U249_VANPL|nr:hypothetical protein HPP92_028717 [Vanilla planifolia]KAG0446709.1 hypothetical protein HPP92_028700 [Vanilla planifolia]
MPAYHLLLLELCAFPISPCPSIAVKVDRKAKATFTQRGVGDASAVQHQRAKMSAVDGGRTSRSLMMRRRSDQRQSQGDGATRRDPPWTGDAGVYGTRRTSWFICDLIKFLRPFHLILSSVRSVCGVTLSIILLLVLTSVLWKTMVCMDLI